MVYMNMHVLSMYKVFVCSLCIWCSGSSIQRPIAVHGVYEHACTVHVHTVYIVHGVHEHTYTVLYRVYIVYIYKQVHTVYIVYIWHTYTILYSVYGVYKVYMDIHILTMLYSVYNVYKVYMDIHIQYYTECIWCT